MKTSLKIIVGRRIREARNKLNLTQQELAEQADVDYKYLQRIEGKTVTQSAAMGSMLARV